MTSTHRITRREDLPQTVAIYNATIPSRMVTANTEQVMAEARASLNIAQV